MLISNWYKKILFWNNKNNQKKKSNFFIYVYKNKTKNLKLIRLNYYFKYL